MAGPALEEDPDAPVHVATSGSSVPSQFKNLLDEHNRYRALHGVAAMSWSSTLATQAAAYAKKCVNAPDPNIPKGVGENIVAFEWDTRPLLKDPTLAANYAALVW